MEETFEQKVIRNVQGKFAVYKTPEVFGDKSGVPFIEWENTENVDQFFQFAANLGVKVIYITEGEDTNELGQTTTAFVQIGFLHQGIMHGINLTDEEEEDDEEDSDEEDENQPEEPSY